MLIVLYPALISITGDHASAVVLSQIFYWHKGRLRVVFHGKYWLAKSRADMCQETGITLKQYKRILPLLVKQGWIVTERHLFKNKVTPFIRLTDAGWDLMQAHLGIIPKEPKSNKTLDPQGTNPCTESTAENITDQAGEANGTEIEISKSTGIEEEGISKDSSTSKTSKSKESNKALATDELEMKAEDILKAHTSPVKGSLEAYWKKRVALVTEKTQYPLTAKERGQLAQLSKFVGQDVRLLIDYAITHWWKFAAEAGGGAGTSFPGAPHIGFLLKHYPVAMNLLTLQVAPPKPVVTPVQLIATVKEPEPVHTLTSQELTEMLKGLETP